ncbi:MAG: bifunctional (p)ppGpp synthetase/guanosine-3',5'-bis(diphosphate) 3'-pyrophosphohydrolase [Prevotella histicola]|jgi:relA/spoT family protein|uniref:RelA/SpoT family protein n=2 Tax=Prevotella histicola TaxID=470565 RepID=UPI001C5FDF24|nr:RelA/SpoT family protein [Prevotella histicola]MBF1393031.1 bifunctional (p)ppGpp synthetase/guanosine-3',5'-bis(diphosphate) 3'-pyrophosphohydrolase [Prevotella histicola]MBF1394724.1 bifunctional (p)ppGpp synthetase/guanosine-3',5'-bis(diphosphate) 3'-pyrophosphohydrolase [Prevotella histicola]MBF1411262.1 bifunctional (p)ppGpp synthetase/guanosine-3',5'-bis(diphosphate) 3'-pyrophosphohydrolase [Prevotella histicola]MBW4738415.1 RelA/SpoT family protein [Prevotella histicola]MBW4746213.1 
MEDKFIYTDKERKLSYQILDELKDTLDKSFLENDLPMLQVQLKDSVAKNTIHRNVFGLNPILCSLQTAAIAVKDIGLKRDSVIAILLHQSVQDGYITLEDIDNRFGKSVAKIIHGLIRIQTLYQKNPIIESENFRNLLLSFAEDMRVILIMIADRVNLMRQIRDTEDKEAQHKVAEEASYLYAPLAHKLGLYQLKRELEDLSLKYLEHDAYYLIKDKLNATKASRDAYINQFIAPVRERLTAGGLRFHIKGRTKSIHSIWQKMKKQKCGFEGIYDLFAIRIILDAPLEKEKIQCWQAYSIVTDMYQPNPKRLRDWLSVPKSNGYECLHITVLGPEKKWVEVQIRTERMDEIAEHGLAAHWRYKGIKEEGGLDDWLASIRAALEAGDNLEVMDQFKSDLYEKEIYVFTPKGDLLKFPKGATILDFAYHIHSKVGNQCVGGKINAKNVSLRTELHSGDTVEILTSATQKPKAEWLKIVKSSRAKAKIRLALKETQIKDGLYAKELLERRFKNKKIEIEESTMGHLLRKLGFKEVSEFYKQVADEKLDPNYIIEEYQKVYNHDHNLNQPKETESAENFEFENPTNEFLKKNDDVLVIDKNLKGLDFSLAKCCHPIYGDPVFGFVTVNGGIKIHRTDCPNAPEMRKRFGYRIVKARWSGKGSSQYAITLRVIGNDDIGIVSNITNVISKDEKIVMRSINIDSHDGLFSGNLVVLLDDNSKLNMLIKKLRTVKGVKQVTRI